MSPVSTRRARILATVAAAAIGLIALSGCGTQSATPSAPAAESSAPAAQWPRTFTNADGTTTEIPAQPKTIASTSASVTGTLLAFDAPVTSSGSASNGKFFAQWDKVAQERKVANLWPAGKVNLEALEAQAPDLIVVSASGADSLKDQIADLKAIAPTILVDYAGQTWQKLAEQLGTATGLEAQAKKSTADFDSYVAAAAKKITVPAGKANIISFNGPGQSNPIALTTSAQAEVLTALGFTIEEPNRAWHTQAQPRNDFVWANYENLASLTGTMSFILSQDNAGAQKFANDPALANLPSVKAKQVYGLGLNSFRVDKYSATEIVDSVVANFAKK